MVVRKEAAWMLFLLGATYMVGELGHFLIGVVSREVSREIHYGDSACFPIPEPLNNQSSVDYKFCEEAKNFEDCGNLTVGEVPVCKWDYSGLGLEYQILAGPSFIFVFTFTGIIWGLMADRFNRVWLLSSAAFLFSSALIGASFATKYWHLVLSRMALAAGESGCSPLAAGMISDMFPRKQRAFAMSLFNWGIYIGYGLSYAIGTYVTAADLFDQGWRVTFMVSGIPGIVAATLLFCTVKDPEKATQYNRTQTKVEGESNPTCDFDFSKDKEDEATTPAAEEETRTLDLKVSQSLEDMDKRTTIWKVLMNPLVLLLGLAACVRHAAGLCWGYNSALYFQNYYPDYTDAGWWLMGISIGGGSLGAAIGGFVSDRLVKNYGISSRAIVLGGSQLLSTPFSIGLLYLNPPYAFISLLVGYLFAEMWFAVMFTILMELVPLSFRSTALAIVLFIINNVGGNVPVLVHPVSSVTSYRTAITIFYSGSLFLSSLLFFTLYVVLRRRKL